MLGVPVVLVLEWYIGIPWVVIVAQGLIWGASKALQTLQEERDTWQEGL